MSILVPLKDQSGYTLMESVVAMALFVSVLIPLGAAIGKLMLNDDSDLVRYALQMAETEMCSIVPQSETAGSANNAVDGFVVAKDIQFEVNLLQVGVTVSSAKNPGRILVSLQKTFLAYR